jgi:tetratricopeptide (TPR) repeat protein
MEPDTTGGARSMSLYSPTRLPTQTPSASSSPTVRIRSIPPTVIALPDSMKLNALSQLLTLQQPRIGSTIALTQLEQEARRFQETTNENQRSQYWELGKMLCMYYLSENSYDAAGELLRFFRAAGLDTDDWFNLMLYLENRKDNYAGMIPYYDLLEKRSPSRAREIGVAKIKALTLGRHWEDAARLMSELPQPLPVSEFIALAQPLAQANQNKLLRPLLEERLSFGPRDTELIAMLGRACAAEGDYDQAIELAEEAWQARSRSRTSTSGSVSMTAPPSTSALVVNPGAGFDIDTVLRDMHRYYSARGKRVELLTRFEQRLAAEPESQRAYENLAQLYRLDGQTSKATETYRKLLEKFPRSVPARLAMASYLVDRGDTTQAILLYEELRRTNPEMATQIEAWLRTLRQRASR